MLSGPLSGVAWDESPLSLITSWSGYYDSQACELDIQAATRGGVRKKAGGQRETNPSYVQSNWRSAGHWGGGGGLGGDWRGRQADPNRSQRCPTTSKFKLLDSSSFLF